MRIWQTVHMGICSHSQWRSFSRIYYFTGFTLNKIFRPEIYFWCHYYPAEWFWLNLVPFLFFFTCYLLFSDCPLWCLCENCHLTLGASFLLEEYSELLLHDFQIFPFSRIICIIAFGSWEHSWCQEGERWELYLLFCI